jgi:hypothetical protein
MFTDTDFLLSTRFTHFIRLPGYHLNMIAKLLCIVYSSCGFEECLILGVKDKQGRVEWSWASAASHGYPGSVQNSLGSAVDYILLGSEIWPEDARGMPYLRDLKRTIVSLRVRARATSTGVVTVFHIQIAASGIADACHRRAQLKKRCTVCTNAPINH